MQRRDSPGARQAEKAPRPHARRYAPEALQLPHGADALRLTPGYDETRQAATIVFGIAESAACRSLAMHARTHDAADKPQEMRIY